MKINKPLVFRLINDFRLCRIREGSILKIHHRACSQLLVYTFFLGILLTGCNSTEGTIEIRGKVIDGFTKTTIPGREIIIQGLILRDDNSREPVHAGQFTTDSLGCFLYQLKTLKYAYSYNFCLVGDYDYPYTIKEISLGGIKRNAKYLFFSLNKLVELTIRVNRISKTPVGATLIMSMKSDGTDGRLLYPYTIENYGIDGRVLNPYNIDNYDLNSNLNTIWIGENIKSTIKTRVFADKRTTVRWVLFKTMNHWEFIDTITCRRDVINEIYFKY